MLFITIWYTLKVKDISTGKLKKKLDAVFSKYIRAKFSYNGGKVNCYTCGKVGEIKTMQCGHFVPRQYLSTRWSEDNCRPQDVGCNVYGNGQLLDFEENLKKELGENKVEELKKSRHQTLKLDRNWYEEKIIYYENLLSEYRLI